MNGDELDVINMEKEEILLSNIDTICDECKRLSILEKRIRDIGLDKLGDSISSIECQIRGSLNMIGEKFDYCKWEYKYKFDLSEE